MEPELRTQRLLLDPALPPWLDRIDARDMRVFDSRVTFRVRRSQRGDRVVGGRGRVARVAAPA
jgi:hypothetical protein